jgi:hypothetical protein
MKVQCSVSNINVAIKAVEDYKKNLIQKTKDLLSSLKDEGVNIATAQIINLGAVESGELLDSLKGSLYAEDNRAVIFVDCGHAAYVEFGTGIVGASNPHPAMPWSYDVNNHGEQGWIYYDENGQRWTKGMPSRPFMFNTSMELRQQAVEIAREVFRNNDKS